MQIGLEKMIPTSIDDIRKNIDSLDSQILQLLNERMLHVKTIGDLVVNRPEVFENCSYLCKIFLGIDRISKLHLFH